ncbi:secondary thiamine-phosphate synthase enzyme YjbQ [Myxococcota bacterium]|nr:secondary thiamine-phosphate synthase enzyme YjbQ [Myxococcota bacterium]MBU1379275.1 secondary thiamine-phosphate synthase enzyme YjbQ [Myxococcota bacterium]MBU1499011.1 secondary thiamine-phosphate synthase enzyme YjbQ [Myxococcota bacterium]
MIVHKTVSLKTNTREELVNISDKITSGIADEIENSSGILLISSPHTTAGITVNEAADPSVCYDMTNKLKELVPFSRAFTHSEGNSDSHIKTALIGTSVQLPIIDGKLILGTWQGVFFCEFDGPRTRKFHVTFIGE